MILAATRNADLGVRTLSAIVMVAVAGSALWLGGLFWAAFVALVAAGVLLEWTRLSAAISSGVAARVLWFVAGVVYVGVAAEVLWQAHFAVLLLVILCVVATDVGAYFSGRRFGGPKIAPRISPSKTWAGLGGGMVAAGLALCAGLGVELWLGHRQGRFVLPVDMVVAFAVGAFIAIIAQAGDFFESWMKRRAGVKDSGNLIPGHGGLFDRLDGLLAVLFVLGVQAGTERFL